MIHGPLMQIRNHAHRYAEEGEYVYDHVIDQLALRRCWLPNRNAFENPIGHAEYLEEGKVCEIADEVAFVCRGVVPTTPTNSAGCGEKVRCKVVADDGNS
jgi:hypothetical protein